ncbi:MAG: bacterioferritin [Aquificae bacterium]|nr:bacterioferritin [Aquificota bacterium]
MDKEKSIQLLNQAIAEELTAIHQYMYFHFILDDLGYDLLASLFKKTAIDEMIHTERFAERILFLGGEIDMKPAKEIKHIREPESMLKLAVESEREAVDMYNSFAVECINNKDLGTKQVFESIIADEENHYDSFSMELENLERFGSEYLSQQAMERSKKRGGGERGQ